LFHKDFRKTYISEKYCDEKIKEFHDHKLGQLTMNAYAKRFLDLFRYITLLKDEKVKVKHFLSGFPQSYQEKIEFYKPKTC
jgi:hypothetical protein